MTQLVLIRGLPGAGKTTLATTHFPDYIHFETDLWMLTKTGHFKFTWERNRQAKKWCIQATQLCLMAKKRVVVSNCFVSKESMAPYFNMCPGLRVFETGHQFKSIHDVKESDMVKMREAYYDGGYPIFSPSQMGALHE